MRKINIIEPKVPQMPSRKMVAAYARVSMESERLQHSLSAQVSYYSSLIQQNPAWEYAGVYADDGITGTKTNDRTEFNRMIADCEAGKIDIILTKSISRFARNTVDLLNAVRHLKDLGISVQFEKEHIDSLSEDGELMLTLLASFAQEEVRSLSDNVKWGTRKRFEKGIPNGRFQIYGYRWDGDHLVVEPEEAKIVKLIYVNFLNGLSAESTEKQLEEMGVKSYKGQHFGNTSIRQILGNITYTGNLLFQKEYTVDPKTCGNEWKSVINARVKGTVCPVCADRAVLAGYNDLATTDRKLLAEWDYEKNSLLPTQVSRRSMKRVWWKCSLGHSWKAKISDRTIIGEKCTVCEKEYRSVFPGLAVAYYANQKGLKVQLGSDKLLGIPLETYIPSEKLAIEFTNGSEHMEVLKSHLCKQRNIKLVKLPFKTTETETEYADRVKAVFKSVRLHREEDLARWHYVQMPRRETSCIGPFRARLFHALYFKTGDRGY